jgi:hypothetical protein
MITFDTLISSQFDSLNSAMFAPLVSSIPLYCEVVAAQFYEGGAVVTQMYRVGAVANQFYECGSSATEITQ